MQSVEALFQTRNTSAWLTNSQSPRILHVFDRACNLIDERGDVLSVVPPEIGNGPFNLVVGEEIRFRDLVHRESEISSSASRLILGTLTVDTTTTKLWSPLPAWNELHDRRCDVLDLLRSVPGNQAELQLPSSPVSDLPNVLAAGDRSAVRAATSRLAGLGAGLTPAGDDFIMGAVYAAWIIHPPDIAEALAEEIASVAAPLTTSLSAAWLRSASRGEAGLVWHRFFEALVSARSVRVLESMQYILAVGATSGADALAGFMSTMLCSVKW